ncbi:NAD(P)H-binding protein [Streptomyces sp. C10-9-1]|uniref:NAD(P)H-binding protein n=1 Tax=Streptomyces sp. C10-9-1 TaxID=1859285 RepID=UPI003D71B2C0
MILLTGATGTIGREVLRLLPPGLPARIMARSPERVVCGRPEVHLVRGDFGDQDSLLRAARGTRTAFLVTSRIGDDDLRFLHAARAAGVRRVVKLSAAGVLDPLADDAITRWQRRNEELWEHSGLEWTLLRPRAFMSNALAWAPGVRERGVVRALYGRSGHACVDPRDVAAVAVLALTQQGHAGRGYTLTGPAAVSAAQQTAHLGEALGRRLRFEEMDADEACAALRRRYPREVADALMEKAERLRAGGKEEVGAAVPALLGRPAGSFRIWARDHVEAFGPAPAAEVVRPRCAPGPVGS